MTLKDERQARAAGPRAVAMRSDHRRLLGAAGFVGVAEVDVTATFRVTAAAWLAESDAHADELARLEPPGAFQQRQTERRAMLAALEGAGCACALFASGMAAATAVFQSLLPGDHVLVSRVLYWGVRKWLAEFALTWGLDVEFVDATDLHALESATRPGRTRLVWVETPANPMWEITDLAAVCDLAGRGREPHRAPAQHGGAILPGA